jgi:hypothetical protein
MADGGRFPFWVSSDYEGYPPDEDEGVERILNDYWCTSCPGKQATYLLSWLSGNQNIRGAIAGRKYLVPYCRECWESINVNSSRVYGHVKDEDLRLDIYPGAILKSAVYV